MSAAMNITARREKWSPGEGERGWHTEEGRRKRIQVIREPEWSARDGCVMVLCAFVDEQMARFVVPVSELEPADATWERVPNLVALRQTRAYLGGRVTDQPVAQRAVAQPVADNDEPDFTSVRIARHRLTEAQRASLDLAEHLGASRRAADHAEARKIIRDVFIAIARGAQRSDQERRLAELKILEEGRHGKVGLAKSGAVKITGRDGLETLLDSEAIDAIQHGAGMKYRDLYERALMDGRIKSLLAERSGSGAAMAMTVEEIFDIDNVKRELARAKRGVPVFEVEKRVRDQVHSEYGESMGTLAVAVLRAIAGAGVTLYSLAPSGRANQRYSLAIKEALTAAADHFGLQ